MTSLKVKVTGPHKHEGQVIPPGEVIELPAKIARLMVGTWKTAVPHEWPQRKTKAKKDTDD